MEPDWDSWLNYSTLTVTRLNSSLFFYSTFSVEMLVISAETRESKKQQKGAIQIKNHLQPMSEIIRCILSIVLVIWYKQIDWCT